MKRIIIIVMVLVSVNGFSQRGYERGYGGMTGQPNQEDSKEEFEENNAKLREEALENMMIYLNKELNLNELQSIAIKQIYTDSNKKQGIILKKEISQDEKMEALKSLSESTEKKVLDLLDVQQKEKFEIAKAELMKGIKKEKPKKDKKKKEKKEE